MGEQTECKTVSAVLQYTHDNGINYMLIVNQAICIPGMEVNLICPMQLRDNDIEVNDLPKSLQSNPMVHNHAIIADDLLITLHIKGIISYFTVSKPSKEEWENSSTDNHIVLTYESPTWDPHSMRFQAAEEATMDHTGSIITPRDGKGTPRHTLGYHYCMQASLPSIGTTGLGGKVSAMQLAQRWKVSLEAARRTIEATTQHGVRSVLHDTLHRRFRTNDRQLRYRRLPCDMFTDTLEAAEPSWHRKNKYAQVFATRYCWVRVFPMQKKSDAHEGLSTMAARDGVPITIIMDNAREQAMGTFRKKAREMGCHLRQTEPYSPWQNAAEGAIRELKRGAGRKMTSSRAPHKLWDHCLELEGYIRSHTALDLYELQGQVPETILSGQTADISPFVECKWYDFIRWYDIKAQFPQPKERYGRWLGPSLDIGPAMTAKILKENGQVIHLSTYRPLNDAETTDAGEIAIRTAFDANIRAIIGKPMTEEKLRQLEGDTPSYPHYLDTADSQETGSEGATRRKETSVTPEELDNYVGAQVNLPREGNMMSGTVRRRMRSPDGQVVGQANDNPILDTRSYMVEFPDGYESAYAANLIAQNMYTQCDINGNQFLIFKAIVDHSNESDPDLEQETTKSWKLAVEWKDGSTSWENLADLKESFPIEVAEYAVACNLEKEPEFRWVTNAMKMKEKTIAAANTKYIKRTHRFGLEIPKTVRRALEIDTENGNRLWQEAIAKEMDAVRVAFHILEDNKKVPPGHQRMDCHMIFDVKLDGFRRKARLVAGGHKTEPPASVLTYASVVSRETVRIALTVAALNDLQVKTSDVQNAYLTAPCAEKIYTVLGLEFGADAGKTAVIVRALYGLKSAGASFQRHLADCMRTLGYKSCMADADLWSKPVVRPDDGLRYYAYILLYVDDCLCIHHDAESALYEIDRYFPMKKGSIGDPDIYLGSKLRKVTLCNGVRAWSSSPSKYVQEAVRNLETFLSRQGKGIQLPKRATAPWPTEYMSELDDTPELGAEMISHYQSLVGTLHWMVKLGRVDMIVEVSMLASHMAMPREGHLFAAYHVFAYIKKHHNSRLVFDPSYPDIDKSNFMEHDWKEFYGNVQEAVPPNAPPALGKDVDLRMYVDSDHAGDKSNRRSRTGFFIYLNSALVMWMSKKQSTIETSVFGAEFVAMKVGIETLRGLRYKLRMMGIAISGPTYIYGDNMSVIHNTQRPESTLKKKSNAICYHAVRESVAMGESLTGHIKTTENPADLATKVMANGQKRRSLVNKLLYDLYDQKEVEHDQNKNKIKVKRC